jgi:nicotinate-nucleotide pyrophosphorylase (carboxylating)
LTLSENIKSLITLALKEDAGDGDRTTLATVPRNTVGLANVKAKSPGVLCGQAIFAEVFRRVDPSVRIMAVASDGDSVALGQMCIKIEGHVSSILTAERTALNFLQHLSGIATLTHRYVALVSHTSARIIDTRKTTPLWRELEKYAVRTGGGTNHRMGLYDMFLIKDNHIAAAGGISKAIRAVLAFNKQTSAPLAIEVETKTFAEVQEAVSFPIQRIMLDNMPPAEMARCVIFIAKRCDVEASGGVTLDTVKAIAETGVDFISVGALTHSAPVMDLSLMVE